MKTAITFITTVALTLTASATSIKEVSHYVSSANGKFKLHVDVDTHTHKITKVAKDDPSHSGWEFKHDAQFHSAFVTDDGQTAAVVHWAWCKEEDLDKPAVVIFSSMAEKFGAAVVKDGKEILATGFRPGIKKSYTYRQLSKPRVRKPDEVGPIGDFWRVWRGGATINGNVLTLHVEGGKACVIDLKNPQDLPLHDVGNEAEKAPQTREEREKMLREREIKESDAQTVKNPKIDPEFLAIKARETAAIQTSFPALKTLLGSITEQSQLTVFGGLPNQVMNYELFEKTLKAKGTVERHGETFFKNPLKLGAEDAESVKTLIRDPRSYSMTTDPLQLAGFGAAYSLVFETNGSVTEIQISNRNQKIRAFHKDADIYSYLTPEAFEKIVEPLKKYDDMR